MADTKPEEVPETRAETEERVRAVEEDRAGRFEKAPLTGVVTHHDLLRHLITHGPARSEAERDELLGVVNEDDPDYTAPAEEEAPE